MKLNLSLGQMNVHLGDPEQNFERVRDWTAEAARRGSALVLFPELWPTGYDLENWPKHADPLGEGMFARLSALARAQHIALASSVLEARDGQAYNTFAIFDAEGSSRPYIAKCIWFPCWRNTSGLQRATNWNWSKQNGA